jgi:hypothetical protein
MFLTFPRDFRAFNDIKKFQMALAEYYIARSK